MDPASLVIEDIRAGLDAARRFDESYPVKAAFWLKESHDDARWYLYMASDRITPETTREAYGELLRIGREHPDPPFDPFRVKLIPGASPLAEAVAEIHRRFPLDATRWGGAKFGGMSVDEVYVYPPLNAVAAT